MTWKYSGHRHYLCLFFIGPKHDICFTCTVCTKPCFVFDCKPWLFIFQDLSTSLESNFPINAILSIQRLSWLGIVICHAMHKLTIKAGFLTLPVVLFVAFCLLLLMMMEEEMIFIQRDWFVVHFLDSFNNNYTYMYLYQRQFVKCMVQLLFNGWYLNCGSLPLRVTANFAEYTHGNHHGNNLFYLELPRFCIYSQDTYMYNAP